MECSLQFMIVQHRGITESYIVINGSDRLYKRINISILNPIQLIKKSIFQDKKKSVVGEDPNKSLPAYGPLQIVNYAKFLQTTKDKFFNKFDEPCAKIVQMDTFRFLSSIGEGTFGKVKVIKHKKQKTYFAVKIFKKSALVEMGKLNIALVLNEKKILQSIDHPLIVRLEYFSQDFSHIYYVMPFVNGGELYTLIRKNGRFSDVLTRFYGAQMVLAMEFLQSMFFLHRDIKPENIIIDHLGFIRLADFSLGKRVTNRTYTFCGTLPYMAPEVIQGQGYGRSADWWSFGILLYEMAAGRPPFVATIRNQLLTKICHSQLHQMPYFSPNLWDLLRKLVQRDITYRFGNLRGGVDVVKKHKFFRGVNWMQLLNRSCDPPFVPKVSGPADISNFPRAKPHDTLYITETDHFHEFFKDF